MTDTPILLTRDGRIAHGMQRDVYLHPTNPRWVIKLRRPWEAIPKRRDINGYLEAWFPSVRMRHFRKEVAEITRLEQRYGGDAPLPVSRYGGTVATNLGTGHLWDAVHGADGGLGQTMRQILAQRPLTADELALLNDAIRRFYEFGIRAGDMNTANFVFGRRMGTAGLGPLECVLVDGLGDIHAIPVRSMGDWAARLGTDDACKRLGPLTGLTWQPKSRQFTV